MASARILEEGMHMLNQRTASLVLAVIILILPILVFLLVALGVGMSISDTLTALSEQLVSRRHNPIISSLLGFFPFTLMLIILWAHRRLGGSQVLNSRLMLGGAIPIILVLLWANFEFWPTFLPDRSSPEFPHGLELLIGPVFFAPIALLAGMSLVRIAWGKPK